MWVWLTFSIVLFASAAGVSLYGFWPDGFVTGVLASLISYVACIRYEKSKFMPGDEALGIYLLWVIGMMVMWAGIFIGTGIHWSLN